MRVGQKFEEKKILIKGLEANYKIRGAGEPILILHGWGGSSDSWISVQKILTAQKFKVIVPDFPGFGKSKTPREPWHVDDYVEWLKNFIKEVKKYNGEPAEPFFLLGHSFGGRIAIKFTAKYPERVKSLILCSSAGIKPEQALKQKVLFCLGRLGDYLFSQRPLIRFKDGARNIFYQIIRQRDYLKANGTMKETVKKILEEDLLDFLPKIKTKTLILWGKLDKMVPLKYAYIMEEKIPNSRLIILPGIGHSPQLDVPEKLAKTIVQFLQP